MNADNTTVTVRFTAKQPVAAATAAKALNLLRIYPTPNSHPASHRPEPPLTSHAPRHFPI